MSTYAKPIPIPSATTEFFWDGCKQHQLLLQQCTSCSAFRFPPSPICPECLSTGSKIEEVSGQGTVHTFGVYHRLYHPGFKEEIPYVVGIIELDEGPRLLSNVIDSDPKDVYCGMPVHDVFEEITEDSTLYKFAPAPSS